MSNEHATDYWNEYYRGKQSSVTAPAVPSQFAAFALSALEGVEHIVELGCGNGRDSLFFARQGINVTGVDASDTAIAACTEQAVRGEYPARFLTAALGKSDIIGLVWPAGLPTDLRGTLLYARFFLHAVPEEAEDEFFSMAKTISEYGAAVAVEFRTDRDERQEKVTPTHYRRFINPLAFHTKAIAAGLKADYFAEGTGFAKYRNDDAHVARFIMRKA